MNDRTTVLIRLMEENWIHTRQSEEKRAIVAIAVLVIASATQITLAFTGFSRMVLPLTIFLFLLGLYGIIFCLKLYERQVFHTLRARKLRSRLDELDPEAGIETLLATAESEHNAAHLFANVRLHHIWLWLHTLISLLGLVEIVLCFLSFS